MKQEEMNTQLYEKLAAEQTKYRDWLMGQPPEEILNHAYEYAVREDILAAAELMDIPQAQAAALLAVPSPMEAIYGGWTEQKSPDLDPMLDCISDRAYAALQAQRELPVYRYPGSYAHEHGELEQYRASRKAKSRRRRSVWRRSPCCEPTSSTTPRPATPMPPTVRLATPQSSVLSTRPTSCSIRRQSRHLIS